MTTLPRILSIASLIVVWLILTLMFPPTIVPGPVAVFKAMWENLASGQAFYIGLAVYAVMMSLIGSFYYLRVVKVMYFDEPITATTVAAPTDVRVVLSLNGALVLILGIVPGGLMTLCAQAIINTLAT